MAMLSEVCHLQDIVNNLCTLSRDPSCLPESAEQTISDATHEAIQPSSTMEHKVDRVTVLACHGMVALNPVISIMCGRLHRFHPIF